MTIEICIDPIDPKKVGHSFTAVRADFRVTSAKRVEGVDYDAFDLRVFVGNAQQFPRRRDGEKNESWPATLLFEEWDQPMDVCRASHGNAIGESITVVAENKSDTTKSFAVNLIGVVEERP